ncbi:hypothetical protein ACOMHN_035252 [Nucella lapillus]
MGKPEDFQGMSQYQGRQTDAAVQVLDCIAFQKFRYSGENRPGKKQQDKPFLRLALYNLSGREAKVQVVCVDAERPDVLHPNGLVGMDCLDGVYTKTYHVSKTPQVVSLPYLRIERTKTRDTKTKREGKGAVSTLQNVLTSRTLLLPSPYRERCLQQVRAKPDTTRVRLGVIVTVGTSPLPPLFISTHVIQNASEKTQLSLLKLSARAVCCQHGGHLDIFTADNGPPITEGRCRVWVSVGDWASAHHHPSQHHILYNRVVTCPVPPYARGTARPVEASLHLSCTQSDQTIACPFIYGLCSGQCADTNIGQQPLTPTTRKRPHHSHLQGILSGNVKLRMKDTVGGEQTADSTHTVLVVVTVWDSQCCHHDVTMWDSQCCHHDVTVWDSQCCHHDVPVWDSQCCHHDVTVWDSQCCHHDVTVWDSQCCHHDVTMWDSQCCHHVVTMWDSQCCHHDVTVWDSQCCHHDVTVWDSQCCHHDVTVWDSQCCHHDVTVWDSQCCHHDVTVWDSQCCHHDVTVWDSQCCHHDVTVWDSQCCHHDVTVWDSQCCHHDVTMMSPCGTAIVVIMMSP